METELAQAVHIYLYMPMRMLMRLCVCLFVPLGVTLRTITTTKNGQKIEVRERESAHKA